MDSLTVKDIVPAKNRKLWIDALRGVAMILVVYGHCVKPWNEFFVFDGAIKMPLFFVITAYLFNPRNGDQREFFTNLFRKLIVPWMVLGMFPYVHPVKRFLDLIEGRILWFMPCLVIAEVLWFYILKFSRTKWQVIGFGLLFSILGLTMHSSHVLHYARVDNAFVVQAFFVLGFVIKNYEDLLSRKWRLTVPVSLVVYALMGMGILLLWPDQKIDVALNMYPNIPYVAIMVILGCVSFFVLFKMMNISPRWLVYIGQNTLIIYILHYQGLYIFKRLSPHLVFLQILPLQVYGLIEATIAILLCCVIAFFVNRYIPIVVGKMRYKTSDSDVYRKNKQE